MKTSLGIWALGSMVTRFVPGGYQPQHAGETTVQRLRRAIDGLGDLMDDYEFHYPQELSEQNLEFVRELADRISILEKGEVRSHGRTQDLRANEAIARAALGG